MYTLTMLVNLFPLFFRNSNKKEEVKKEEKKKSNGKCAEQFIQLCKALFHCFFFIVWTMSALDNTD